MSTTKQTKQIEKAGKIIMKKSTRIILYVLLILGLIGFSLSLIQYFTKGIAVDWTTSGIFFAVLTCAFCANVTDKDKKEEK